MGDGVVAGTGQAVAEAICPMSFSNWALEFCNEALTVMWYWLLETRMA
jgi:hypothetical protein